MSEHRPTFTIRRIMVAIAVIAVVLAAPNALRALGVGLSPPCLALLYARRLHALGAESQAGWFFWLPAVLINGLYLWLGVYPMGLMPALLCLIWGAYVLPILAGFGGVWARLKTREDGGDRPGSLRPWFAMMAMTGLPLLTAGTLWPMNLVFLWARPALDHLADGVAAGQAISFPRSVGPYRIVKAIVDPATGGVGLVTDPNPNGPSGFVRGGPSGGCHAVFRGDWCHLDLGFGWCYHEED